MTEWDLAKAVFLGLTAELKVLVDNFGELLKTPFDYNHFEQRVALFYKGLTKETPQRSRQTATKTQSSSQAAPKEDIIWRIHAYLDSVGKCHFCKKTCGNAAGTCPGPLDRLRIKIPSTFVTPPKTADYKVPRARGAAPSTTAGRPTNPPAGRPSNRGALVAAVTKGEMFPELDAASVSALAALDEELRLVEEERYVDTRKPTRLIIQLHTDGGSLLGLIDTGAEINLVSEEARRWVDLPKLPLAKPLPISLALQEGKPTPISLSDKTKATLYNPPSGLEFEKVTLKVGPVVGPYDAILGAPFLSCFLLSISLSQQSIQCDKTGQIIFDY
jgi:hypothetical protein